MLGAALVMSSRVVRQTIVVPSRVARSKVPHRPMFVPSGIMCTATSGRSAVVARWVHCSAMIAGDPISLFRTWWSMIAVT
jgi:hypothetical protein